MGANLSIEYRLGGDAEAIRRHAAELVALADVIVTAGSLAERPCRTVTRTIPIVMANVADPVGAGWVQSLARPGGNAQPGFTNFGTDQGGKWVELLTNRARRRARGDLAKSDLGSRYSPICCHPVGSALAWGRSLERG